MEESIIALKQKNTKKGELLDQYEIEIEKRA